MFDRDEQEISQIIENGLEAILTGGATLESVVAQHPEQAEVIRPELEGALWLVTQRQEVEPRPGFVKASRRRVVERIKAEAKSQGAKHAFLGFVWPTNQPYAWTMMVVILILLLTGAGGMLTISQNALPGDGLYAVKRASEQVSYSVTLNEVQKVQLSAQFAERRLEEARVLIEKGDYATAGASLQDYTQGVELTMVMLEKVKETRTEGTEVKRLAASVNENMVEHSKRLSQLASTVPMGDKVTVQVHKALDKSIRAAVFASQVYDEIDDQKASPTLIPSAASKPRASATAGKATATSAPTRTPAPTSTMVPPTAVPVLPPVIADTPVPPPADTFTPSPSPTATITPMPTATITATATASATASATDTPTELPTPSPTSTSLPTATDTPQPTATATEEPTPTSTPEPNPVPTEILIAQPTEAAPVDETPAVVVPDETASPFPAEPEIATPTPP